MRAGHRLTHLAGRDPGPGVLVSPQDDLDHARRVLGPRGQGHTGVIVGSHSHVETGEVLWPLHILELILVGCGDMDSLWTEGRREGIVGAARKSGALSHCGWASSCKKLGCWLNDTFANSAAKVKCSQE